MIRASSFITFVLVSLATGSAFAAPCDRADIVRKSIPQLADAICLDSARNADLSGNTHTFVFYKNANYMPQEEMHVVDARLDSGETTGWWVVDDAQYFPSGCGMYIKGARVLPGTDKIAILYAHEVIRLVNAKTGAAEGQFSRGLPGVLHCEGYTANVDAERERVQVNTELNRLEFTYTDRDGSQKDGIFPY